MTLILAIDPGPEQSGVVLYDTQGRCLRRHLAARPGLGPMVAGNAGLCATLSAFGRAIRYEDNPTESWPTLAIEWVESYGTAVGASTFHTCRWVGRFEAAWGQDAILVPRRDVKTVLCGGSTWRDPQTGARKGVKDPQVNAAIRERFPQTGGGARPAVGTKKQPGPLYGVKSHVYAALGVALTAAELLRESSDAG